VRTWFGLRMSSAALPIGIRCFYKEKTKKKQENLPLEQEKRHLEIVKGQVHKAVDRRVLLLPQERLQPLELQDLWRLDLALLPLLERDGEPQRHPDRPLRSERSVRALCMAWAC